MSDIEAINALMLEKKIRDKLSIETDEFVSRMKGEILLASGKEIEEYVTDYIYEEIDRMIDQVVTEIVKAGKSIIKSKGRKISKWFKKVFRT